MVALSSTEAEFIAAYDTKKYCLYIGSILHDVSLEQDDATIIYKDNRGTIEMDNVGHPIKRVKHMDMRHFAIHEWLEQDLIRLKYLPVTIALTALRKIYRVYFLIDTLISLLVGCFHIIFQSSILCIKHLFKSMLL